MATLDQLLRRSVTSGRYYRPFTQPRYSGPYPLGSARRVISSNPNTLPQSFPLVKNVLFSPSRLSFYEDRRRWHPEGAFASARSMVESYPQLREKPLRQRPFDPDPYDPRTGEIYRDVPSKKFPFSTPIPWRPSVLERASLDPWKMAFSEPWKVIICLKRKMRKEIMHALGYAGQSGFKKPKFTQYSQVRCF